jgi:hypothetical protein
MVTPNTAPKAIPAQYETPWDHFERLNSPEGIMTCFNFSAETSASAVFPSPFNFNSTEILKFALVWIMGHTFSTGTNSGRTSLPFSSLLSLSSSQAAHAPKRCSPTGSSGGQCAPRGPLAAPSTSPSPSPASGTPRSWRGCRPHPDGSSSWSPISS